MIYLGGSIERQAPEDCFSWRDEVMAELGKDICLDPTRRLRSLADIVIYFSDLDLSVNEVVHNDLADLWKSEIALFNYDDPCNQYIGTSLEVAYALIWHKRIVIWSSWAQKHPFLAYHATIILPTLPECLAYIKMLLYGSEFKREECVKSAYWPEASKVVGISQ